MKVVIVSLFVASQAMTTEDHHLLVQQKLFLNMEQQTPL